MKVYISGQITGLELQEAIENFDQASGEVPAEMEDLIVEFNKKLSEIKGYYYCDLSVRYVQGTCN